MTRAACSDGQHAAYSVSRRMPICILMAHVIQTNFSEFIPFEHYADEEPLPCSVSKGDKAFTHLIDGKVVFYSISHMLPFEPGDPGKFRYKPGDLPEFRDGMVRNVLEDFDARYAKSPSDLPWNGIVDDLQFWDDMQLDARGSNLAVLMRVPHVGENHFASLRSAVEKVVAKYVTARLETITGTTLTRTNPHPVGRNEPCPCGSGKKYKNCSCRFKPFE